MASTSDTGDQDALLHSRVEDAVRLCDKRCTPCFLGFLDEREQQQVRLYLRDRPAVSWVFYGGHPEAERQLLGIFPEYTAPEESAFELTACAFRYRKETALTHRDFLGSLLAAGLRREAVGDILCGEGLTVVFLRREMAAYVEGQIRKIGGEGVRIELEYTGQLPQAHHFVPLRETIASPRLDAVLKALLHCSRQQAAQLIAAGDVQVNHLPVQAVASSVAAPATISVRGYGRFAVDEIGLPTKKGRLVLSARQYR